MIFILIILAVGFSGINFQDSEDTRIGQVSRPFAEIANPELINFFLDELLIPEADVTKLEIIDVTANGFGPDDIVVTHPSMRAYIVEEPSESALGVMRNWSLDDFRVDSDNINPDIFDPEITGNKVDAAQYAIIADLLRTLNRNYAELPIRMRLERDESGFTFEMWDYEEGSLQYTPPSPLAPDSVFVNNTDTIFQDRIPFDLDIGTSPELVSIPDFANQSTSPDSVFVYETENDTIILDSRLIDPALYEQIAPELLDISDPKSLEIPDLPPKERNLYDVIYISKTVTDTIYIPEARPAAKDIEN